MQHLYPLTTPLTPSIHHHYNTTPKTSAATATTPTISTFPRLLTTAPPSAPGIYCVTDGISGAACDVALDAALGGDAAEDVALGSEVVDEVAVDVAVADVVLVEDVDATAALVVAVEVAVTGGTGTGVDVDVDVDVGVSVAANAVVAATGVGGTYVAVYRVNEDVAAAALVARNDSAELVYTVVERRVVASW